MTTSNYATERETTEGRVFTVTGGDWDTVVSGTDPINDERIVVNMGPQHPSTHGVLRLILELEGETVTEARSVVGYLHTGIEKNLEYRNWAQGTTFVTRMDYLAPMFNETGYCLAVEKLLGITDQITERATTIRVLMMELNRISSHLVWLATTGMELGAISMMLYGFREREYILDIFEMITGLRMNHAYVRPGGVAQDVPDDGDRQDPRLPRRCMPKKLKEYEDLLSGQPIWHRADAGRRGARRDRLPGARHHRPGAALRRPRLGPAQDHAVLRLRDLRVRRADRAPTADVWGRYLVRLAEIRESLKIVEQALDRLRAGPGDGRRQEDRLAGAARHRRRRHGQLAGARRQDHGSVDGVADPPLQAGHRGLPGPARPGVRRHRVARAASWACTRSPTAAPGPYRVHYREPSFVNLQAIPAMAEGGLIADVIAGGASLDPVMGGCDR